MRVVERMRPCRRGHVVADHQDAGERGPHGRPRHEQRYADDHEVRVDGDRARVSAGREREGLHEAARRRGRQHAERKRVPPSVAAPEKPEDGRQGGDAGEADGEHPRGERGEPDMVERDRREDHDGGEHAVRVRPAQTAPASLALVRRAVGVVSRRPVVPFVRGHSSPAREAIPTDSPPRPPPAPVLRLRVWCADSLAHGAARRPTPRDV